MNSRSVNMPSRAAGIWLVSMYISYKLDYVCLGQGNILDKPLCVGLIVHDRLQYQLLH